MRRATVTTPADDQELPSVLARITEAPPLPLGDPLEDLTTSGIGERGEPGGGRGRRV